MIDVKNVNELLKYKESLEKDLGYEQINNNIEQRAISWGDIYLVQLDGQGSEQKGVRPFIITQNDDGNKYAPTILGVTITSKMTKAKLPTHVEINGCGLPKNSVIMTEQTRVLDKKCRLIKYIGHIDDITAKKLERAIVIAQKRHLNPLDRIKDEDVREIIEDKLDSVRMYEKIITEGKNEDFIKECLHRRESELSDLKDFCLENNLNYRMFYNQYEPKIIKMKAI